MPAAPFSNARNSRGDEVGVVLYSGRLTPELCDEFPDYTFVFGDNLLGFGMGGQAIIRGKRNAFGVPTKRKPSMAAGSFFEEGNSADLDKVLQKLKILWLKLANNTTVVIPVNDKGEVSLGLERAELPIRAPSIYETITRHVSEMAAAHGSRKAADGSELSN